MPLTEEAGYRPLLVESLLRYGESDVRGRSGRATPLDSKHGLPLADWLGGGDEVVAVRVKVHGGTVGK